jgi:CBS domain-containing protein
MNVREVMTPDPRTIGPGETLQGAARIMKEEDTGAVPVVEGGKVVGMVTDRDIAIRAVAEGAAADKLVRDILSGGRVIVATPDMSTKEANQLMGQHQVRRLPVVDQDQKLVGIVSLGDLAVKEGKESRTGDTLENISEGVKRAH